MARNLGLVMTLCFATLAASSVTNAATANQEDKARENEEACITDLRIFNVAQATYQYERQKFASSFKALGPDGETLIDSTLASGTKDGYRFHLIIGRRSGDHASGHYAITAVPVDRLTSNQKSFYTDETGVIRFTIGKRPSNVRDSPLPDTPHEMLAHPR